jgi:hypothetical protein
MASAASYVRGDERLDLLYAYRPIARRTQDLEDIRALLRAHHAALDMEEVRGYFRLFERESLLDELLRETG